MASKRLAVAEMVSTSRVPPRMVVTEEDFFKLLRLRPIVGELNSKGVFLNQFTYVVRDINDTNENRLKIKYLLEYLKNIEVQEKKTILLRFCDVLRKSVEKEMLPSHKILAEKILNELQSCNSFLGTNVIPLKLPSKRTLYQRFEWHNLQADSNTEKRPKLSVSGGDCQIVQPSRRSASSQTSIVNWSDDYYDSETDCVPSTNTGNSYNTKSAEQEALLLVGLAYVTRLKSETIMDQGRCTPRGLDLALPTGPLKSPEHRALVSEMRLIRVQSKEKAMKMVFQVKSMNNLDLDLKLAAIQAVVPSSAEAIPILQDALELCGRAKNPVILKCRIHYRLVWCYYRIKDMEKAQEHADASVQLASLIGGDFGPAQAESYYARLQQRIKKPSSKEDLDQVNLHHSKVVDIKRTLPEWMKSLLVRSELETAMHKVVTALLLKDEDMNTMAAQTLAEGQQILEQVDKHYFEIADKAFYCQIKFLQHKVDGRKDMAKQMARRAIAYHNECGRKNDAQEVEIQLAKFRSKE